MEELLKGRTLMDINLKSAIKITRKVASSTVISAAMVAAAAYAVDLVVPDTEDDILEGELMDPEETDDTIEIDPEDIDD